MSKTVTVEELIEYLKTIDEPKSEVHYDYGGTIIPLTKEDLSSTFSFIKPKQRKANKNV